MCQASRYLHRPPLLRPLFRRHLAGLAPSHLGQRRGTKLRVFRRVAVRALRRVQLVGGRLLFPPPLEPRDGEA